MYSTTYCTFWPQYDSPIHIGNFPTHFTDCPPNLAWRFVTNLCRCILEQKKFQSGFWKRGHLNQIICGNDQTSTVATFTASLRKYRLTPWNKITHNKLVIPQTLKKFSAFYGTLKSITALRSAHHPSLFWAKSTQSTSSQFTSSKIDLILYSPLRQAFLSDLFPSGFTTKSMHAPLLSNMRATCLAHYILLDLMTR